MSSPDNRPNPVSRREFLRNAGMATGAATGFSYALHVDARDLVEVPHTEREREEIREAIETLTPEASLDARIAGETHMRLVELECDFVVAGGGMAGVCAAVAAARNGAQVILVQDRSRLGGNASSEIRMHIVGADHHTNRPGWRESGLIEEFRLENAVHNPRSHWEMWDLMLYDKVIAEPNIRLILDSNLYAAAVEGNEISEVLVRCDKTEHIYRIKARYFADCTGDCRLGLEAGAVLRTGHEGRDAFGESLAPPEAGPGTLGSSILFTAKQQYEWDPVPFKAPSWARKITKEHLKHRNIRSWEYGYWWIEWGGNHSAIHDNERIRFELLSIVLGVWDYIKNSGEFPDAANWCMDWIGMIPGKRASRRLDGPHILTQHDCMSQTGPYTDAVAIGGWPFDNHPPAGFDDPEQPPYDSVKIEEVYSIPLRSMFSENIHNLFMAGRNLSASHVAFTSTRVMATCSVIGQAVGTAAAYCAQHELVPKELVADGKKLQHYRQGLLRDDQTIKGLANADPNDLARKGRCRASGAVDGSAPSHILTGLTRDMPKQWDNRWGGPMDEDGAWVEVEWDTPQDIGFIQLVFDTGFHRQLTLSEAAAQKRTIHFGAQPETVRDYTLLYRPADGKDLEELASVRGNYQRLRRHHFTPVRATAVRLHVHATNGSPEARLYEMRCYA